MRQPEWINAAEFNCHKWKRYVLDHRYSDRKKNLKYIGQWLKNFSFWIFLGYGVRSRFWPPGPLYLQRYPSLPTFISGIV